MKIVPKNLGALVRIHNSFPDEIYKTPQKMIPVYPTMIINYISASKESEFSPNEKVTLWGVFEHMMKVSDIALQKCHSLDPPKSDRNNYQPVEVTFPEYSLTLKAVDVQAICNVNNLLNSNGNDVITLVDMRSPRLLARRRIREFHDYDDTTVQADYFDNLKDRIRRMKLSDPVYDDYKPWDAPPGPDLFVRLGGAGIPVYITDNLFNSVSMLEKVIILYEALLGGLYTVRSLNYEPRFHKILSFIRRILIDMVQPKPNASDPKYKQAVGVRGPIMRMDDDEQLESLKVDFTAMGLYW
ncbi:MAG: hypothetical protein KAH18_10585 [Psychromonas sp.]|nr:hypothetical protein [Psychromonas sp.]